MRRVKRGTLKRYEIPQQSPVEVRSHGPGEWMNVEGMRYNPKTKWWDGVPEDAIPYIVMDHVKPGFRGHLVPITAEGQVFACRDRKQPGSTLSSHAVDCDKAPTDHAALLKVIERFKKEK